MVSAAGSARGAGLRSTYTRCAMGPAMTCLVCRAGAVGACVPPPTGGYPSRRRRAAKVDIGCDTDGPRPPRQWFHHWADTDPPRPSVSGFRRNARRRPHVPVSGPLTGAAALENCRDTVAPKPPRARASLGAGGGCPSLGGLVTTPAGRPGRSGPSYNLPPAGRIDPPGQLRSRPSPWSSPPPSRNPGRHSRPNP